MENSMSAMQDQDWVRQYNQLQMDGALYGFPPARVMDFQGHTAEQLVDLRRMGRRVGPAARRGIIACADWLGVEDAYARFDSFNGAAVRQTDEHPSPKGLDLAGKDEPSAWRAHRLAAREQLLHRDDPTVGDGDDGLSRNDRRADASARRPKGRGAKAGRRKPAGMDRALARLGSQRRRA